MRTNFLQFVESKKASKKNEKMLLEAFSKAKIDKVIELLDKVLSEKIPGLYPLAGFTKVTSDGEDCSQNSTLLKLTKARHMHTECSH